jgi:pimeloyl-ACP methyl ester carboxylesterase
VEICGICGKFLIMPYIVFQKKRIFYNDSGKGQPIVLLHGFTESQKIWNHFVSVLSQEFRVITVDLPGHGKSECVAEIHTMELQAEVVHAVLKKASVKKCIMTGHSMGGYVTLAYASKYPKTLKGFCIFHSHCFADSIEDREIRSRTIELVKKDKFGFVAKFIPGLFPEEVQGKFGKKIDDLVREAEKMTKEGVIAALEGMKIRNDQTAFLASTKLPVLFILGLKDSKAPISRLWEMISLPAHSESLILRDVGHMGYIESPKVTLNAIQQFVQKFN